MIIDSKVAYVKKRATFETLIPTIPIGLNPIVFIEDTREMWTCGTYFSIGYPNIEVSESGGSVKVEIGNSYFTMSTTGESLSVRKGDGNKIILSSNALTKVDTEAPLEWDITNKKLLHSTSKVTPGSYGQSSNLGNASTFTIPNIVVDKYGHITSAGNSNIEIRDYVEQIAPTSLIGERNILLSYNEANNNSDSAQVRKARGMTYNDSTQRLRIEKGIDTFGTINVTHGDMVVVDGYIIGKLKGDVEGEATPKIHLSEKPEYGGSSTKLYGHVLLKDILGVTKPNPSSNNTNVSSRDIEAYAASPLMVWNTLEDAKKYADSLLGANNAMLFQEAIVAGTTTPGTFTPAAEIGHTYIVDFDNSVYTNNVGYINGEPVEIGDMLICKTKTPASDSSNWREIHDNWTYVQTNTTGTVVGPSSSAPGQIALFSSSSGRVIKGLPTGSMSQILSVGSDGMPTWVNAPDRLNNALSFKVNSNSVLSYDGSVARYINLIQGSNVSITHDSQGNIIINSDAGEDTKNTAGATNNINNKLFLVGALTQDSSPQTYTNQYIYIGADNKLYVNNAEVSVQGHIHPYLPVDKPAVGIQGGIQGSLPYQSATNITSMLTPPTTNGWVLKYNTATKAPYWAEDLNTVYGTKEFTVNSIKYNVYTESETLPTLWAPSTLGTRGQIAKVNDSETGFIWADDLNTTYSTQNMNINGTDYAIYTTASGLPSIKAPNVLGTANTVLATNSTESGFVWVAANNHNHDWNQILNKPTTFKPILNIVSDWDNIFNDSNWGFFSGANNSPINGTSVMGINIPLVSTPNYAMQLAGRNDILYFRTKEANTNQAWRTILHSGNSSVSKSAETLTVKLNGVSQSLTNTDTWIANALNTAGYVAAPTAAQSNMVWKTDSLGNPAWRLDEAGSDTLNTTGATNLLAKKLFITGAETQTANPQTYTNENVYIGIDNCLYSNGKKVLTDHQSLANYVTLDTAQEIRGQKTFTAPIYLNNSVIGDNAESVNLYTKEFGGQGLNIRSLLISGTYADRQYVPDQGLWAAGSLKANSFVKHGGLSSQFLKADGSIDSNAYVTINHNHVYLLTEDYRNRNPLDFPNKTFTPFFLSGAKLGKGGYYDAMYFNSYSDSSGGKTNLLAISKVSGAVYRMMVDQGAATWNGTLVEMLDTANWQSFIDGRYLPLTGGTMTANIVFSTDNIGILFKGEGYNALHKSGDNYIFGSAERGIVLRNYNSDLIHSKAGTNYYILDTSNWAGYIDGRYLKLSGGTLTGALTVNQDIKAGHMGWKAQLSSSSITNEVLFGLALENNSNNAYIRMGMNKLEYFNGVNNTIWHSGNDGSGSGLDADTLDGVHFHQLGVRQNRVVLMNGWNRIGRFAATSDAAVELTIINNYYNHSARLTRFVINAQYQNILCNLGSVDPIITKVRLVGSDGSIKYLEVFNNSGSENNTYIFSASNIVNFEFITRENGSGTASSEWNITKNIDFNSISTTKLQTPRSIWGQSYDGTGDVDGLFRNLVGTPSSAPIISHKTLAHPSSPYGLITKIWSGGEVSLQAQRESNDSEVFPLLLNVNGGNVGIGLSNPSHRLHVHGDTYSTGVVGSESGFNIVQTGLDYCGLQPNFRITSSGDPKDIWLYNLTRINYNANEHFFQGGNARFSNKIIVDMSRYSNSSIPSISLAIGDTDTGFDWASDGVFKIKADALDIAQVSTDRLHIYKNLTVDGTLNASIYSLIGQYISGGTEKPNYFAPYGLKVNMLNVGTGWADCIYFNGYMGGNDVPYVNMLVANKMDNTWYHIRSSYNATSWGTLIKFWDSANFNPTDYLPLAGGTMTGALNMNSVINMNGRDIVTSPGTIIRGTSSYTELITQYGSVQIGPMNEGHAHIYTDRPNFYFNKALKILGNDVWHAGNFNPGSYLPLSGGTITGKVYVKSFTEGSYGGAIEIRERDHVTTSQSDWDWAPRLSFHWGGRHIRTFGLRSDGLFAVNDVPISLSDHTHNYVVTRIRENWNDNTVINNVIGQLAWNNYGNGHTIFDASKSLTPNNSACSNSTPQNNWTPSYPTLMGWNGIQTYGVKVNRADIADTADVATTASVANRIVNDSANMAFHWSGQSGQPTWLWGGNGASDMYLYNPSNFSVNYATTAGNVRTMEVVDNRGADRAPSYYTGQRLSAFFNESIPGTVQGSWHAGITVKGWSEGYAAWQLFGYSSTGAPATELFFRTGITDSWGTTAKLYHSLNSNNLSTNWSAASLYLNGDIRMNNGSFSAFSYRGGNLYISDGGRPVVVSTPTFSIGDANHDYMSVSDSAVIIDSDLTTGKFKQSGSQSTSYPRLPVVLLSGIADLTSGSYGVNFLYNPLNLTYSLSYDYSKMMLTITIPDQKGVVLYFPDEASLNCQICLTAQGLGTEASNPRFATHRGVGKNAFAIMGADDSTSNACRIRITIMYWGPHGW